MRMEIRRKPAPARTNQRQYKRFFAVLPRVRREHPDDNEMLPPVRVVYWGHCLRRWSSTLGRYKYRPVDYAPLSPRAA